MNINNKNIRMNSKNLISVGLEIDVRDEIDLIISIIIIKARKKKTIN